MTVLAEIDIIASQRKTGYGAPFNTIGYTLDALGNPLIVTTNGRATAYSYDQMNRRIKIEMPGGRIVNQEYYPTGELKRIYGSDTYNQVFAYDNQGRRSALTTYRSQQYPQTTSWQYDSRGQLVFKTYPDGQKTSYTYHPDGNLQTRLWARGVTTTYAYDNAGRLTGAAYSDQTPAIGYQYDWMGNVSTVADASGTRTFTYDYQTAGHPGLVSETIPHILNHSLNYGYDSTGRRTSMTLRNNSSAVAETAYRYDARQRLGGVTLTPTGGQMLDAALSRKDTTGQLTGVNFKRAGVSALNTLWNYDQYHRVTSVGGSGAAGTTRTYSYTYNDRDQCTRMTYSDGSYWDYQYDDLGQLIDAKRFDGPTVQVLGSAYTYEYDQIGNRIKATNGIIEAETTYKTNALNQYVSKNIRGVVPVVGEADVDATVKAMRFDTDFTYQKRAVTMDRSGKYFSGHFNVDNRENAVEFPFKVYAFKDNGYKEEERTVTVPKAEEAFSYDVDGNLLTHNGWTYTWNGENRLIKAEKGVVKLEFNYDYMGRRFEKKVYENGVLTKHEKYIYDGFKQIACYRVTGETAALDKLYSWLPTDLDVPLWVYTPENGSHAYHTDANKNIRALYNADGAIAAEYDYDPFGNVTSLTGDFAEANPFRFSSEFHDAETGLVYYNYRYYDPTLGRWLNRDPIEEDGGVNLYGMVGNNAINQWDIYGLWTPEGLLKGFHQRYGDHQYTLLLIWIGNGGKITCGNTWFDDYHVRGNTIYIAKTWWLGSERSDDNAAQQLAEALARHFPGSNAGSTNWLYKLGRSTKGIFKIVGGSLTAAGGLALTAGTKGLAVYGGAALAIFGGNAVVEGATQFAGNEHGGWNPGAELIYQSTLFIANNNETYAQYAKTGYYIADFTISTSGALSKLRAIRQVPKKQFSVQWSNAKEGSGGIGDIRYNKIGEPLYRVIPNDQYNIIISGMMIEGGIGASSAVISGSEVISD